MNENQIRRHVVETAEKYLGYNESNGSHKKIIDLYNSHRPLARNYPVKYGDYWCATYVSAIAIECGYTDIMPTECSCQKMIDLYKKLGRWEENDAYIPKIGDILMYDWNDNGIGDNKGRADHVGLVVSVAGDVIAIIEGNYKDEVGYRTLRANAKYIRGYCLPDYASKSNQAVQPPATPQAPVEAPKDKKKEIIREWQKAAIADGFKFPKYGADGEWGKECESVAKSAICKYRYLSYRYKNLTKIIQRAVGFTGKDVDGKFGKKTKDAVAAYQRKHGLVDDGCVGLNTWKVMLGV
jgi:peptidoglycan hydrolase-like protein with peptidoglycan-binding domain